MKRGCQANWQRNVLGGFLTRSQDRWWGVKGGFLEEMVPLKAEP